MGISLYADLFGRAGVLAKEGVKFGDAGHGGGAADAGHDHCGSGGPAQDGVPDGQASRQPGDEGAKKAVTRAGGFQGLGREDAGGKLTLLRDRDRALFAHLVDDDLRPIRNQAARLCKCELQKLLNQTVFIRFCT